MQKIYNNILAVNIILIYVFIKKYFISFKLFVILISSYFINFATLKYKVKFINTC